MWFTDWNVKSKIVRTLENNENGYLYNIGVGKDLLNKKQKHNYKGKYQ